LGTEKTGIFSWDCIFSFSDRDIPFSDSNISVSDGISHFRIVFHFGISENDPFLAKLSEKEFFSFVSGFKGRG
jgi:hypothetical protein